MVHLHTLYDFADERMHQSYMIPGAFLLFGLYCLYYHFNLNYYEDGVHGPYKPMALKAKGISTKRGGIGFGLMVVAIALPATLVIHNDQKSIFNHYRYVYIKREYKQVEGYIQNFHKSTHRYQNPVHFTVDSVKFKFGDYSSDDYGYNIGSRGFKSRAIKQNDYVRIAYFNNDGRNVILKLEKQ